MASMTRTAPTTSATPIPTQAAVGMPPESESLLVEAAWVVASAAGSVIGVSALAAAAGTGLTGSPQPVAGHPLIAQVRVLSSRSVSPAAAITSEPVAAVGTLTHWPIGAGG